MSKFKICIVDDHTLFANALAGVINNFDDYHVTITAENGKDFIHKIESSSEFPDIILLDLNMPIMNGFETLDWIKTNKPDLKVIVLSMNDDEFNIIQSLKKGANGYLLKNVSPKILKEAFDEIIQKGVYHNELVSNALLSSINNNLSQSHLVLKENELIFLKLSCSEMTYKEIADEMNLSPKTIDGYRQQLFEKLNVKSRVGLVMYAIQNNLIDKNDN